MTEKNWSQVSSGRRSWNQASFAMPLASSSLRPHSVSSGHVSRTRRPFGNETIKKHRLQGPWRQTRRGKNMQSISHSAHRIAQFVSHIIASRFLSKAGGYPKFANYMYMICVYIYIYLYTQYFCIYTLSLYI